MNLFLIAATVAAGAIALMLTLARGDRGLPTRMVVTQAAGPIGAAAAAGFLGGLCVWLFTIDPGAVAASLGIGA